MTRKIQPAGTSNIPKHPLFYGIILFALVGTILLIRSFAAAPNIGVEAESSILQSPAEIGSHDASASGTGDNFVLFKAEPTTGTKCVIDLHGKSGSGGNPFDSDAGYSVKAPQGNTPSSWGNYEWRYFPESSYQEMLTIITDAAEGCGQVIVHGFSNGAAAAAYLYCRGETLGGRLVGVIVDDPVMDNGVDACSPGAGVRVKLYTTGGIPFGPANCTTELGDWTCINGVIIGLSAYTSALGVGNSQSSQDEHTPYGNPPELGVWW